MVGEAILDSGKRGMPPENLAALKGFLAARRDKGTEEARPQLPNVVQSLGTMAGGITITPGTGQGKLLAVMNELPTLKYGERAILISMTLSDALSDLIIAHQGMVVGVIVGQNASVSGLKDELFADIPSMVCDDVEGVIANFANTKVTLICEADGQAYIKALVDEPSDKREVPDESWRGDLFG